MAGVARLERLVVLDDLGCILMEHDGYLSMVSRDAILGKRIEVPRDTDEAWIHFVSS